MKTIILTAWLALTLVELVLAESAVLAWDANPEPDIAGYVLSYRPVLAPEAQTIDVTDGVETPVTDLEPGVTYQFSVHAYNTSGEHGPESDPITYRVPNPPSAPTTLRVVEIQTSANLKDWKTIALVPQSPESEPAEFVRARITSTTSTQ